MADQTILLKGDPLPKEGTAGGAITPGHLVQRSSGSYVVHATAAGNALPAFAKEDSDAGQTISDDYASGDRVRLLVCRTGDEVHALVAAGAAAIADGDALESAGDGTLRVVATEAATADTQRDGIVAYAREAVDNSGGAEAVRIKVEVR